MFDGAPVLVFSSMPFGMDFLSVSLITVCVVVFVKFIFLFRKEREHLRKAQTKKKSQFSILNNN